MKKKKRNPAASTKTVSRISRHNEKSGNPAKMDLSQWNELLPGKTINDLSGGKWKNVRNIPNRKWLTDKPFAEMLAFRNENPELYQIIMEKGR